MAPLLDISDLNVRFLTEGSAVHAVNGFNLTIEPGKAVAIVGESGSGKSTVMMAVMRLLANNAAITGQVHFDGKDLLHLSDKDMRKVRGREISMIFQNPSMFLNPTKTVGEQIVGPLLYHHLATPSQAREKAVELLEQVGIPDPEQRMNNYPFELSGGQLQRVMIGMALIAEPKLLIADEPTTALDVTVQAQVLVLLKKLQRDRKMGLVFVTHDLAVAAQIADDIYVMYGGLVMEHLRSEDLMEKHAHPYLEGLLKSIPLIDGPRQQLPFIAGQPVNTSGGLPDGCVFAERCEKRYERCTERPSLLEVEPRHKAACWLVGAEVGR